LEHTDHSLHSQFHAFFEITDDGAFVQSLQIVEQRGLNLSFLNLRAADTDGAKARQREFGTTLGPGDGRLRDHC
jgi:hypothetical protein